MFLKRSGRVSKNRILNGAQGHPHPKGPWPRRGYVIRTNIDGKREIERESEWMTNRAFEPLLIRADLTVEPYFSQPLVPGPKIHTGDGAVWNACWLQGL